VVRDAAEPDAGACAAIYAPYVSDTAISFEISPPSVAEMAKRISAASRTHAWVVLEDEGRVVGYAYGVPFHTRAAYRWACQVSSISSSAAGAREAAGRFTRSCCPA
jgi:L-amino acid N-acyltransferase YncA